MLDGETTIENALAMLKLWQQIWLSYRNLMQSKQNEDAIDF